MKLRSVMLLSATGMVATAALVWTSVPARGSRASDPPAPDPGRAGTAAATAPTAPEAPAVAADHSHFQAGKTLMVEGRLGHRVLPSDTDNETFLFVDVSADRGLRAAQQVPLNLAIVIDRSGSMRGKRLTNAMAAARSAINRLRDGDVVSVVTYNTAADVAIAPTLIGPTSRAHLLAALAAPRATGDTCISCGIDTGMRLLAQRDGMVSRILLLSDGEATAGVRDLPGFKRIAEDCRRMGASITTIGVDVDFDERVMSQLALDSNGRHFFVEDPASLATIFDQEMDALTQTTANRAELTVDLAPGVFADHVFDRATAGNGSQVVVPLGAFTAGNHKTLLVRLRVPRGAAGERPVAAVRLRYDDLVTGKAGDCEGAVATTLSADPSQVTPLDGLVSARVSASETAEALEDANALFRAGHADQARHLIEDKQQQIGWRHAAAGKAAPLDRAGDVDSSFTRQETALSGATRGFDATPAPTAAAPNPEPARPSKVQVRNNQKDAFDLAE